MPKPDPQPLPPPGVAPAYLLAAVAIWAAVIASLLLPSAPAVHYAALS